MSGAAGRGAFAPVRMLPIDLGVALVVLVALGLGALLRFQVEGDTRQFQEPDGPFRIAYPANWIATDPAAGELLRVENPRTVSTFKTTLSVENQLIDPSSPPTLQTLVDRRVAGRDTLTAYRLLTNEEATVDGARAARIEYAYVAQPIDAPGRVALPVVVRCREYIVVGQDRTYYITLAAPQEEFAEASRRFDRMIEGARIE